MIDRYKVWIDAVSMKQLPKNGKTSGTRIDLKRPRQSRRVHPLARQPGRVAAVCGVQRLTEHILAAARVVAEVEPVDGAVIRSGDRGQDGLPSRPRIDAADNQVRA